MSFSINRVTLKGNLGKDPEIRAMQNGDKVASFSVATSETWTDKNGQKQERTQWHNIVCFPKWTVAIAEGLKKGATVLVEGQLQTRSWEDQAGQKRYTTEVVLNGFNCVLDKIDRPAGDRAPAPQGREDYGTGSGQPSTGGTTGQPSGSGGFSRDLDDEIPF